MNRNPAAWAWPALSVILAAIVLWQAAKLRSVQPAPEVLPPGAAHSSSHSPAVKPADVDDGESAPRPAAVHTKAHSAPPAKSQFHWRQVESPDYRAYIQNLLAVGCPVPTVRDIVSADVLQAYAARRREAVSNGYENFDYWRSDPEDTARRAELARQRRALDDEITGVLRELLGPEVPIPNLGMEWKKAELERQLDFLPNDKRQFALHLLLQNFENDQQVRAFSMRQRVSDDATEHQQILDGYAAKRAELLRMLSPEEFARLEMTASWTAENIRRGAARFQPTEAEFQALFQAWQPHDENIARLFVEGKQDPGNDHVFAQIRASLGEERFELFRKTWWK